MPPRDETKASAMLTIHMCIANYLLAEPPDTIMPVSCSQAQRFLEKLLHLFHPFVVFELLVLYCSNLLSHRGIDALFTHDLIRLNLFTHLYVC